MDRGLRLACEQCDFSVTLYERIPFVVDADGNQQAVTSPGLSSAGYWTDSLCGECRLPVRLARWTAPKPEPECAVDIAVCPRCGAEPMSFESALRELAEACHSRAWLDLATEQEARGHLVAAIERSGTLAEDIERGDTTTFAALDELARQVSPEAETVHTARMPLASTHTLDGLGVLIENATTVQQASSALLTRLRTSELYVQGLETCVEDEGHLSGVPCPQCGTGHLVHWPVWL